MDQHDHSLLRSTGGSATVSQPPAPGSGPRPVMGKSYACLDHLGNPTRDKCVPDMGTLAYSISAPPLSSTNLTGNGCQSATPVDIQPGCCKVAPLWPYTVQRADWCSMSQHFLRCARPRADEAPELVNGVAIPLML